MHLSPWHNCQHLGAERNLFRVRVGSKASHRPAFLVTVRKRKQLWPRLIQANRMRNRLG